MDKMEVTQIYGPVVCPLACSECADGKHHWVDGSIDPDDDDEAAEFYSDHPGIGFDDDLLLAHYVCKHCSAVGSGE